MTLAELEQKYGPCKRCGHSVIGHLFASMGSGRKGGRRCAGVAPHYDACTCTGFVASTGAQVDGTGIEGKIQC